MLERGVPYRSGRVVRQSHRFIGLGLIPEEPEMNPCNYNESIQDKDATLWQRTMNTEMESMYSKSGMVSSEFTLWDKNHRISESIKGREG